MLIFVCDWLFTLIQLFRRTLFGSVRDTGLTKANTTRLVQRLASIHKRPNYRRTGTHPFPRSVSVWRLTDSWGSPLSTARHSFLHSLIADGQYRPTSLGRNKWIALTDSRARLQPNCNQEGFNTKANRKARVGILGNNENDCRTCDSAIGFGVDNRACGDRSSIRAMCYILVQWWSAFKWILKQHQNR